MSSLVPVTTRSIGVPSRRAWLFTTLLAVAGCHRIFPFDAGDSRTDGSAHFDRWDAKRSCPLQTDGGNAVPYQSCCHSCSNYLGPGRVAWPIVAEVSSTNNTCDMVSPAGQCSATGYCAADFLKFGSCLGWKEYEVVPGCTRLVIVGCSDGCTSGNALNNVSFDVQEFDGAGWVKTGSFQDPSLDAACACTTFNHILRFARLRIVSAAVHGFYCCVFVTG
jgi:hypothetical protein